MNTVTFGTKNSYADFGLILDHKEIGKPEPRINKIEVPARDGALDLTEAFGEVKYKERKLVFYFSYIGSDANWSKTLSALNNYINGQKLNIYFEEDYYWVGRCSVGDAQTNKGIRQFTIECDCEPYKRKLEDTIIETKRKNIFDINKLNTNEQIAVDYNNKTITTNGSYASNSWLGLTDMADVVAGKTYTINFKTTSPHKFIILTDSLGNAILEWHSERSYTFTQEELDNIKRVYFYGVVNENHIISEIQIEEGATATAYKPYDTDIKIILNDRKTVTPYVEIIDGAPILSWEDRKTGVKYNGVAIPSNGKYLDLKLYEGKNTLTVKGGDIRLTYREASL